jgi:hypothetical protein
MMTLPGWKTLIVSVLFACFGALQGLDWVHLVPDKQVDGWIIFGIGVVMGALRYLTVGPSAVTPTSLVQKLQNK